MICRVIALLPMNMVSNVAQTCKDLATYSHHDSVWMERCLRISASAYKFRKEEPNWRAVYKRVSFGFLTEPHLSVDSEVLHTQCTLIDHIEEMKLNN
jgi:hypothetical protein